MKDEKINIDDQLAKVIKEISRIDKENNPDKYNRLKEVHDTLYKQLYNIDVNRTWS